MTVKPRQKVKHEVLETCQKMLAARLVIGSSGNVSSRIENTEYIAITPSSLDYSCMEENDVIIMDLDGNMVEGDRNPSMEHPFHLAIYKARPDVNAILHTHSIYASTLAVKGIPLPPIIEEFINRLGGQVEVAEFGLLGSQDLAHKIVSALGPRNAVLLANHGAVCCGPAVQDALKNALLLERVAQIYLLSLSTGKGKYVTLPPEAIEIQQKLFELTKGIRRKSK